MLRNPHRATNGAGWGDSDAVHCMHGVGLNVNQTADVFAAAGLTEAASMAVFTGVRRDCGTVARSLLHHLDGQYDALCARRPVYAGGVLAGTPFRCSARRSSPSVPTGCTAAGCKRPDLGWGRAGTT